MLSAPRTHHSKAARSDRRNVLAEEPCGHFGWWRPRWGSWRARSSTCSPSRAGAARWVTAWCGAWGGRLRPRSRHGGAVAPRLHGGPRTLGAARPSRRARDGARGALRASRDARGRRALRVDELRAVPNDRATAWDAARPDLAHGHRTPDLLLPRAPRVLPLRGARSRRQIERGDTVASLTP